MSSYSIDENLATIKRLGNLEITCWEAKWYKRTREPQGEWTPMNKEKPPSPEKPISKETSTILYLVRQTQVADESKH